MGVNVYVCALSPVHRLALCREFQASVYAPCAFERKTCAVPGGSAFALANALRAERSLQARSVRIFRAPVTASG
jgi:hypothetical protein